MNFKTKKHQLIAEDFMTRLSRFKTFFAQTEVQIANARCLDELSQVEEGFKRSLEEYIILQKEIVESDLEGEMLRDVQGMYEGIWEEFNLGDNLSVSE